MNAKNVYLIWIISILNGLIFYAPIYALYLHQELPDFTQVSLIMAVQSGFIILLEIPSGAFADIFGRKNSLVISAVLHCVSLSFFYLGSEFWILILFAFFSALVQSLSSGTVEAILYDSLSNQNSESNDSLKKLTFKRSLAIIGALWPISASIASLVGGFISVFGYKFTILITFIPIFIKLLVVLGLKETDYIKPEKKSMLKQIKNSLKVIRFDNQLILLLLSGFLVYSFAEVAFQMKSIYLQSITFPIQYIGIISTLSFMFSFIGSLISENISRKIPYKKLLIICQISIGLLLFLPTYIPFAFLNATIMSIESLFWGMRWPIQIDWINSKVESKERATINSASNLMNHLGLTIFIIISGLTLEFITPPWLFRIIGLVQILTVFFIFGLKEKIPPTLLPKVEPN
jgi:MFS family permease